MEGNRVLPICLLSHWTGGSGADTPKSMDRHVVLSLLGLPRLPHRPAICVRFQFHSHHSVCLTGRADSGRMGKNHAVSQLPHVRAHGYLPSATLEKNIPEIYSWNRLGHYPGCGTVAADSWTQFRYR